MNTRLPALLVSLLFLLTACATALQPNNYREHISSNRLGSHQFQIDYRQDPLSIDTTVADLSLLRSTGIALHNGYPYFVIVDAESASIADAHTQQTTRPTSTTETTVYAGKRYHHTGPAASNAIICFKDKPAGSAYLALFVKACLHAKYGLDQVG